MKVNFLIAGTQKSGTSSMDAYLRQHPELSMAKVKEPHFFDDETEFANRKVCYDNYHRFFYAEHSQLLKGEATPIYTFWPKAMVRIQRYNPEMRMIVLLRNPVERAWSAWQMEKNRGAEILPFGEAIRRETERTQSAYPLPHRVFSYVSRGFYNHQIQRVIQYFPGQALFLKSEDFFSHSQATVNRVLDFLKVSPFPIDTSLIHFKGSYEGAMSQSDRKYLAERFERDVKSVEKLLDWKCNDWLCN